MLAQTDVLLAGTAVLGLLGVLGVILHVLLRARYDARVYVTGGDVRAVGRLSPAALSSLREFFRNDFPARRKLIVLIKRRPDRKSFELRFIPDVSAGERQRVRNFLAAHV